MTINNKPKTIGDMLKVPTPNIKVTNLNEPNMKLMAQAFYDLINNK